MPLPNGNPTAAELDRYLIAEKAWNEAKAAGLGDEEAKRLATEAVAEKRREQVLRSVGVDLR